MHCKDLHDMDCSSIVTCEPCILSSVYELYETNLQAKKSGFAKRYSVSYLVSLSSKR
jgi:hypothetical protein